MPMTFVERARALFGMPSVRGFELELPDIQSAAFAADSAPKPLATVISEMSYASGRVTRPEALSVGAIKRGRDVICSGLATLPLETIDSRRNIVTGTLLDQIDPNVPDSVVISQTIEDLLFESVSWWEVIEFDEDGWPLHARHLDISQVTVNPPANGKTPAPLPSGLDPRGEILVDGKPADLSRIIKFDSLNTPLLRDGGRVIRRAIALDRAAEMYANEPRAQGFFTPADSDVDPGDDDQVEDILNKWAFWRRTRSTGYVPAALKYNTVDQISPADLQLVDLQQRVAVDIANMIGLDPDDVGVPVNGDTYNNAVDRRQDRINNVLSLYASAVSSRLSMPDVTRPNHKVRFDFDGYLRADPKTRIEVAEKQLALGLITIDEYREREGLPALTSKQRRQYEAIRVKATVGEPVREIEGGSNGSA